MRSPDSPVHRYHDGTKHAFNRFARSLGYLDWASQPHPFRSFSGVGLVSLPPAPEALAVSSGASSSSALSYDRLRHGPIAPQAITISTLGDFLRHALGLSAWKQYGSSRWSLRVNPSSGNLHPTEAYIACGATSGLSEQAGVYHYAPDRHALERRCRFEQQTWSQLSGDSEIVLIALTSIVWRESWKYGERAFRYCQHDLGHAIAAIAMSARLSGWRTQMLPPWSHRDVAALAGIDRDEDFVDVEREEPACVLAVGPADVPPAIADDPNALCTAVRAGVWTGRASLLSSDHLQWTFIDDVVVATEDPGRRLDVAKDKAAAIEQSAMSVRDVAISLDARALILQRRSAVAFDAVSELPAGAFYEMLAGTLPTSETPWSAMWWTPRIHLFLIVHRVRGVEPGLYLFGRDPDGLGRLRAAIGWDQPESAHPTLPLLRLAAGDFRSLARRLSCDQDIAADGFFTLGMIAEFDASLAEHGQAFYRQLFWEAGVVGQLLYLDAEAAGARATGIGCFYDDPVHETLGLTSHAFQSLYHFTVGMPVGDSRLTIEPGYSWER